MYMIRNVINILLLSLIVSLPLSVAAQGGNDAEKLLDKAVSQIKSDGGVQMNFSITIYDASGDKQFKGDGVLKLDGKRFALLTDEMKLWCDGVTQWSYIASNNEIYISEPNADDARAFSPVHIMELYKNGFRSEFDKARGTAKVNAVTLISSARGNEIKKVSILLDKITNQPTLLVVYYENGTYADIKIDSYRKGCKFTAKEFRCREKDVRGAEVVDMR